MRGNPPPGTLTEWKRCEPCIKQVQLPPTRGKAGPMKRLTTSVTTILLLLMIPMLTSAQLPPTCFDHTMTMGDHQVRVAAWGLQGSRSLELYLVQLLSPRGMTAMTTGSLIGSLEQVWLTDLDQDDQLEVLILSRTSGGGSQAELIFLESDGFSFSRRPMPELSQMSDEGYRGGDVVIIQNQRILREFPVYRTGDADCCPTGGTMRMVYSFENDLILLQNSWLTP
jgi:hypothetical protein